LEHLLHLVSKMDAIAQLQETDIRQVLQLSMFQATCAP
jgi:hypothetical protein